ncbi:hypothetical protein IIA16_05185 [bacterium]|nr:hypothetical protein [bacterium]
MKRPPPPPSPSPPARDLTPAERDKLRRLAERVAFAERKLREHDFDHQGLRARVDDSDEAWWAWWHRFDSGQNARPLLYILLAILLYLLIAKLF